MAFGFRPVRTLSGAPFTQGMGVKFTIASAYASNIFPGDIVTLSGDGSIVGPGIILGVAGATCLGVFGGLTRQETVPSSLYPCAPSWIANTVTTSNTTTCFVYMDSNIVYQIQTSGNLAGATGITSANLGLNANFVYGAGSASTNTSGTTLDLATLATTAALNLKVWALADLPGNVFYNATGPVGVGNIAEVTINNHFQHPGVAGV